MPRYFLNIRDGDAIIVDPEGDEADDLGQIHGLAEDTIRDILARPDVYGDAAAWDGRSFEITDVHGTVVLTVPFRRPTREVES